MRSEAPVRCRRFQKRQTLNEFDENDKVIRTISSLKKFDQRRKAKPQVLRKRLAAPGRTDD